MKRLAKKWKSVNNSGDDDGKYSLPASSDFQPIDTEEQAELVRSLERSQAQQSRFWRQVFAGLLWCFVAFLMFSIYGQTTMPWELIMYYFMNEIEPWDAIAAGLAKFRWDVIWLPLGPLSGAGFCLYADTLLNESSKEVIKLRNYMYAYKAR